MGAVAPTVDQPLRRLGFLFLQRRRTEISRRHSGGTTVRTGIDYNTSSSHSDSIVLDRDRTPESRCDSVVPMAAAGALSVDVICHCRRAAMLSADSSTVSIGGFAQCISPERSDSPEVSNSPVFDGVTIAGVVFVLAMTGAPESRNAVNHPATATSITVAPDTTPPRKTFPRDLLSRND